MPIPVPALLLLVAPLAPASGGPRPGLPVQDDPPVEAGTQEASAQEASGPRALEANLMARCEGHTLTRGAFLDALVWRKGRAPEGRAALRSLLELRMLEQLARERGIEITRSQIDARIAQLERQVVAAGEAESIAAYLVAQGIEPSTFREYMRLALVHEALTRDGLGLGEDAVLTGEMQTRWLEGEIEALGAVDGPFPWTEGPVVTCGNVVIRRAEFEETLTREIDVEEQRKLCYELLLAQRIQERVPDLTDEAIERAMDAEVERRRARAAANETYEGVPYEDLLKAQGLSIEALRRDPAIRVSALAHLFVDRAHPGEDLLQAYLAERELFDGLFGEGVEVYALMLNAGRFANDLMKRDFEAAEAELEALVPDIQNLADFQRYVLLHSEDRGTRDRKGLLGTVRRGTLNVPEALRAAVFEVLDGTEGDPTGRLVGPVRLRNGVVLLALGERHPAPTWDAMRVEVHRELRRRLIHEALPPETVVTRFDPELDGPR